MVKIFHFRLRGGKGEMVAGIPFWNPRYKSSSVEVGAGTQQENSPPIKSKEK